MTALIVFLVLTVLLLAPFGIVAAVAAVSHRDGTLRLDHDDHDADADARRIEHDLSAIRARFEQHPVSLSPGVLGERR